MARIPYSRIPEDELEQDDQLVAMAPDPVETDPVGLKKSFLRKRPDPPGIEPESVVVEEDLLPQEEAAPQRKGFLVSQRSETEESLQEVKDSNDAYEERRRIADAEQLRKLGEKNARYEDRVAQRKAIEEENAEENKKLMEAVKANPKSVANDTTVPRHVRLAASIMANEQDFRAKYPDRPETPYAVQFPNGEFYKEDGKVVKFSDGKIAMHTAEQMGQGGKAVQVPEDEDDAYYLGKAAERVARKRKDLSWSEYMEGKIPWHRSIKASA